MKKRKSGLLQRMMAVLLSAVLVTGMVSNAVPTIVFAQEDGETVKTTQTEESKEPAKEETESGEQDTDKPDGSEGTNLDDPETEDKEDSTPGEPEDKEDGTPEDPDDGAVQGSDDEIEQENPEPDEETGEEITEPGTEEENESESVGDYDAPTESVSENNITDENNDFQSLLARIAALPDAEEYLAKEPDTDSGEADEAAYEEWLAGLYAYAEEALAIQEAIEELSEEAQAAIPEETLAKLAAWVELAQTVGESAKVMAAESSMVMAVEPAAQTDNIASGDDWVLDKDGKLTISSDTGMTNWKFKKGVSLVDGSFPEELVTSVEIRSNLTSIVDNAFTSCTNLTKIAIPGSVKSIGNGAFYSCKKLTEITIPESVEEIKNSAFGGCTNLQTVTVCSETPPKLGGTAVFYYCDSLKTIAVPNCTYYKSDWALYEKKIVPASHTGGISYSVSDNEITQKCGGCDMQYGLVAVLADSGYCTYTGAAITPCRVIYGDYYPNTWTGEKPTDTDITYENNINAGRATASLTIGTGADAVTATYSFTIAPIALTDSMVTLSAASFPHTGSAVTPTVTVKHGITTLIEDTDYYVDFRDNIDVGTAIVIVTGTGNYTGTVTKTFEIVESNADKAAKAKTIAEIALAGITATNATTKEEILGVINTALGNANITGVTVGIDKFKKQEASINAAGKIEGVVFIQCGQKSESINMDKPIAQLTAGKYMVAVNNGTGGGEYAEGSTVTITADAPVSGKQFDKWVVNSGSVILADSTSSTTTFTMPAEAVSVTATYKDKPGGGNQGGGSGGGNTGGDNQGGGNSGGSGGNSGGGHSGGSGNSGSSHGGNNGGAGATDGMQGGGNQGGGSDGNSQNGSSSGNGSAGSTSGTTAPAPAGQPRVKQEQEGNIQKEVSVTGEHTLDASVAAPISELADMVLTQTEKQQAADGTNIQIVLDVKEMPAAVGAADRTVVEAALNGSLARGYTLGQYLDISLYKVVGDSRSAITQTNRKITVTIQVPDSLKNSDSTKTRTFAVIRVHDGKAQLLPDLDSNAETITIETDRFSIYAIVYQDTANADGGASVMNPSANSENATANAKSDSGQKAGGGMDNEPQTGDATPIELCATLSMIAGFTYLLLYFADRKRGMTEETKKELVSRLIGWGKQGGKIRKYFALAAIFTLLVYYHSIGKKTCVEWKEVYGE